MNDKLNRNGLISGVSIQCGISRQDAEIIVNSMLRKISDNLNEGKGIKIKSFGDFKNRTSASSESYKSSISFLAGKKLNSKVNNIFENLTPARKVYDVKRLENIFNEFGIKDFITLDYSEDRSLSGSGTDNGTDSDADSSKNDVPVKRLISDKLIDLHNEIVNPEGKKDKKNLWG